MHIDYDSEFSYYKDDPRSGVVQIFPDVYVDSRGSFCEVMKTCSSDILPEWMQDMSWVKQVNRSVSAPGTVRGLHAQSGASCQGKLVQAVRGKIVDVIVDARPSSDTFGVFKGYILDASVQNQLWVPRGFLHAFAYVRPFASDDDCVFEYFCDNVYDKQAEVHVNPRDVVGMSLVYCEMIECIGRKSYFESAGCMRLSKADEEAEGLAAWGDRIKAEYEQTGREWWK